MSTARVVRTFVWRDALLAMSYRVAFLIPLVSIFVAVPVIYYLSQVFGNAEASSLAPFGGHYFAFLLLGMAFQDYVTLSQSTFVNSVREHQMMGTLEIVMLSPIPVPMILLCSSLWSYLFTSLRFGLYVGLGLLFGLDLSHANLASFASITVLAVLSFAALGILSAAVGVIVKRAEGITMLLTAATLALGGVAYPISVLPGWLQTVAQTLPFTHALSGVRKALLMGASPWELRAEMIILAGFVLLLFPLGLWTFDRALHRAKATGTLGQY